MTALSPVIEIFRYGLKPIAPFTWFGLELSVINVAGAVRKCMIVRQLRQTIAKSYQRRSSTTKGEKATDELAPRHVVESRSYVRDITAVLLIVHGAEFSAPFLGVPPGFLISGKSPVLLAVTQVVVELLPSVPEFSLQLELPLSFLDAITRTLLLVHAIPSVVLKSPFTEAAQSPWTLLLTSFVAANTGFFLVNMLSFLHPTPLTLTTPSEMLPYGWTTTNLWSAPLITGLYALLTHAQPFWVNVHASIAGLIGSAISNGVPEPVDYETARATCAVVLMVLFAIQAWKKFGGL